MYKTYVNYDIPTAIDANAWLNQGVIPVANQTERDAIVAPYKGQLIYRTDIDMHERYSGSAWKKTPLRPVRCRVLKNVAQNGATSATATTWNSTGAVFDTDGFYSTTNNTRMTAPYTGLYEVNYALRSTGTIAGSGNIRKNGTTDLLDIAGADVGAAGAGTTIRTLGTVSLTAGDYLELMVTQASTGGVWSTAQSYAELVYLGDI